MYCISFFIFYAFAIADNTATELSTVLSNITIFLLQFPLEDYKITPYHNFHKLPAGAARGTTAHHYHLLVTEYTN